MSNHDNWTGVDAESFGVIARPPEQALRTVTAGFDGCVIWHWVIKDEETAMSTKKTPPFETIPTGTDVTWHYRSAIGHGIVAGIHKQGTTAANTMYSIKQHDHHPGEPAVVHHSGKALTRVGANGG